MNKVLLGVLLGAILGAFDGATAWLTPEVRPQMLGIIIGSTVKGIIAGAAAGLFARKVNSTVAGVVFGLVVGLALAYAVAAMGGGKYYFEIMLPGGTVGAILGWATQRYGRGPSRGHATAAAMAFAMALFGVSAYAGEHDHAAHAANPAANAAFEKLKSLAGRHEVHMTAADGPKSAVEYRVTAGGSAVVETMFIGEPHEMVTVYTTDGDAVTATHFCSGGSQPVLRLNAAKSKANELVFDFVSMAGKKAERHINGVRFRFDGSKVEEVWSSTGSNEYVKLYYISR